MVLTIQHHIAGTRTMFWRSPYGKLFSDPTEAMIDAISTFSAIRYRWAPRKGDLALLAQMTADYYQASPGVRRRVDAILEDAGYCVVHWVELATEPYCPPVG